MRRLGALTQGASHLVSDGTSNPASEHVTVDESRRVPLDGQIPRWVLRWGVGYSGQDDNVRIQCVARVATSTLSAPAYPRTPAGPARRIFGQTTQTERRSPRVVSVGNPHVEPRSPSTDGSTNLPKGENRGAGGFLPLGRSPPSGVVSGAKNWTWKKRLCPR